MHKTLSYFVSDPRKTKHCTVKIPDKKPCLIGKAGYDPATKFPIHSQTDMIKPYELAPWPVAIRM